MTVSSIELRKKALALFSDCAFLSPVPQYLIAPKGRFKQETKTVLTVSLAFDRSITALHSTELEFPVYIAPFAQSNYYAEAVSRLQSLAKELRAHYGGVTADYQILCNSPIPEKPAALAAGLGFSGKNSLIITQNAGSCCVIALLSLPFKLSQQEASTDIPFAAIHSCGTCTACVSACPSAAISKEGHFDKTRCIQWYASNEVAVPSDIAAVWGPRLYGCTICQDVCPWNQKIQTAIALERGTLPSILDAKRIIAMSDTELRAFFKGSTLDRSWLCPSLLRRNAQLAINWYTQQR